MQRKRKYFLWLWLGLACCQGISAQNSPGGEEMFVPYDSVAAIAEGTASSHNEKPFLVRNIVIEGNRVTRPSIILREIPFKSGDVFLLQDLVRQFEVARKQLMNTSLFHEVIVALKSFEGYNIDILVQVRERWYIFPVPYFKPVDRNLNQWLVEQKARLNRVNYGGKLLYNNVTGRNDKLRLWIIGGYTRQFSFNYDRLYIDKQMKWGMNVFFATGKNREMNYMSENDKQVFLKDENYVRNFTIVTAELTYRRAIKTRHRFGIGYTREKVADTVAALNPNYLGEGIKQVSFPELYYMMTYYDLDYIPYPSRGYAAEVSVKKKGFTSAFNLLQLTSRASAYWPTGKRSFFSLNAYGALKLPFKQPYFNQKLLGYEDAYLQGYEYYVIDGVAAGYLKAAYTRKLINFNIRIPGTKKIAPQRIPFNIYARMFGNTGYVHHPEPGNNSLSNKMLFTGGFGLDITTIYDFTLKLDWSFNQLGQNGIFIHKRSVF
ncbi:POTRA domain-containing protein [Terrimonas pollutisoli]|uniref:POTRA domain-containing protein n=1 Tax=Terrimonas pollutisoli TaxID=3034147 RepID=UPI0023ED29DB|nr:POTRA domain-containing protein [Terrimonas sp. H1YJ31]